MWQEDANVLYRTLKEAIDKEHRGFTLYGPQMLLVFHLLQSLLESTSKNPEQQVDAA